MKLNKKSFFYLAIIVVLGVVFLLYNFNDQPLRTLAKIVISKVQPEPDYPKPSVSLNDDEFKSLILKEVPLVSQDVSDLAKVSALREWVSHNVPTSEHGLIIDNLSTTIHPNRIPMGTRIQIFREGLAGAWCGATAQTLREVYELFGFEAYSVNQGVPETKGTHVFNIVKINHKGKKLFSIQDAYLNCSISDVEGNPISYFQFLSLLKAKKHQDIKIQWGKLSGETHKLRLLPKGVKSDKVCKTFSNENSLVIDSFSGCSCLLERCTPRFTQDQYPLYFLYICAYPFGIHGKDRKAAAKLLSTAQDITKLK